MLVLSGVRRSLLTGYPVPGRDDGTVLVCSDMDDINVTNETNPHIGQDAARWRRSSKSSFNGNCVEVAAIGASVLVRDSKNLGPVMQFRPSHWTAFIDYVKKGSL